LEQYVNYPRNKAPYFQMQDAVIDFACTYPLYVALFFFLFLFIFVEVSKRKTFNAWLQSMTPGQFVFTVMYTTEEYKKWKTRK